MDYEQALAYLLEVDLVPYQDLEFETAVNAAIDALRECVIYRKAVAALSNEASHEP